MKKKTNAFYKKYANRTILHKQRVIWKKNLSIIERDQLSHRQAMDTYRTLGHQLKGS